MSSLGSQSQSRKERLAQLRSLKRKNENSDKDDVRIQQEAKSESPITIKSRNYDHTLNVPKTGFNENPTYQLSNSETVEVVGKELEESTLNKLKEQIPTSINSDEFQLEINNLKPKKANWDLKRDLEGQLEILEQRTDEAIYKLVKERLQQKSREQGVA